MDYFLTSHENINDICDFEVISVGDLVLQHNLVKYGTGKVSDHSVSRCKVKLRGQHSYECHNKQATKAVRRARAEGPVHQ